MKMIMYLIQVSACTGIFYLFYHLVLSRLTFFTINRWYLLATLLISFIVPAITIPADTIPQDYRVSSVSFSTISEVYTPVVSVNTVAASEPFNWTLLVNSLYFAVAGTVGIYFLASLFVLLRRIKNDRSEKTGNIKLLKSSKRYKNGSFFNCIFINDEQLSAEELEQVIAHELVHVEQKHSVDKIIVRITQVILWFNPFVYAYSNAIDANHEYEVDHRVALNSDKEAYAQLILRLVASGNGPLYQHFSKFPLSKRIALLFTKPSKNMKKLFYLAILPLLVISCLFFTKCESNPITAKKADKKISTILTEAGLEENPLVLIDGKEYKAEKLEEIGRGRIGQAKVIIRKGAGSSAKGVVEISTKNGKIERINITSSAGNRQTKNKFSTIIDGEGLGENPLVLIDEKEYKSEVLYKISPKDISSVAEFSSEKALKKFGDKAKDGAVVITLSNGKISYATEIEKENTIKLQSIPSERFYTRISIKEEDGSVIDRIIIKDSNGYTSCDLNPASKAAFFIDGKIYEESDVAKFDQSQINALKKGISGTGPANRCSIPGINLEKYEVLFFFNQTEEGLKAIRKHNL